MVRQPKPPSQTWRTFLKNHVGQIAAVDFFTVPTVTFRVLYVFLVLRHERRRVVHFNVTDHPTAPWAAQQIVEAFPRELSTTISAAGSGRDLQPGTSRDRIEHMGIEEVLTALRSPWQSPYVERLIGSIRRECLDHLIVFNEDHLRRILAEYFDYYHEARVSLVAGTQRAAPAGRRAAQPRACGQHSDGRRAAPPLQEGGLNSRLRPVRRMVVVGLYPAPNLPRDRNVVSSTLDTPFRAPRRRLMTHRSPR